MGQLAEHRDRAQIERVARCRLEGADAALTQHDLLIPDRENVFGGTEPFVDGAGQTALEQDRRVDLSELA